MSRRSVLAYGALGLPLAMAALPVYVHVPRLYAEVSGMSLSLLGLLLLVSRLADAGIDPLLGGWSDRTAKRQRLILLALPLLAIGMVALLHPPQVGAPLWLLGSLLLTYFAFSLASVAYQAWGAELGRDSGERTRLTASREGFGLLGVVLAAALPGLLSSNTAQGLSWLSWIFVPVLFLLAAWTLLGAPLAVQHRPASGKMLGELWRVLGDLRFRKLLTVFVLNGIAAALPATLVLFFCRRCVASRSLGRGVSGALFRQRYRLFAGLGDAVPALWSRSGMGCLDGCRRCCFLMGVDAGRGGYMGVFHHLPALWRGTRGRSHLACGLAGRYRRIRQWKRGQVSTGRGLLRLVESGGQA